MPLFTRLLASAMILTAAAVHAAEPALSSGKRTLNVLFIGNSYTARHDLSLLVKKMAEEGDPNLSFEVTTVIYGGRTLADHWRLGTQNVVRLWSLDKATEEATLEAQKAALKRDPKDNYAKHAIERHTELLKKLDGPRPKWDIVVLQSYRDDLEGDTSKYAEYAPKFAELIHAQGARVVLYETTPTTQNAEPLTSPPDRKAIVEKEKSIARLAKKIDATVVPMAIVAQRANEERPDLTLRFVNDGHLNQTLAYMTACTFYGVIFDRSPVGLKVDTVTDTRYLDEKHRDQDRDGRPLKRTFSAKDCADMQRIAWEGLQEFKKIAAGDSSQ